MLTNADVLQNKTPRDNRALVLRCATRENSRLWEMAGWLLCQWGLRLSYQQRDPIASPTSVSLLSFSLWCSLPLSCPPFSSRPFSFPPLSPMLTCPTLPFLSCPLVAFCIPPQLILMGPLLSCLAHPKMCKGLIRTWNTIRTSWIKAFFYYYYQLIRWNNQNQQCILLTSVACIAKAWLSLLCAVEPHHCPETY